MLSSCSYISVNLKKGRTGQGDLRLCTICLKTFKGKALSFLVLCSEFHPNRTEITANRLNAKIYDRRIDRQA